MDSPSSSNPKEMYICRSLYTNSKARFQSIFPFPISGYPSSRFNPKNLFIFNVSLSLLPPNKAVHLLSQFLYYLQTFLQLCSSNRPKVQVHLIYHPSSNHISHFMFHTSSHIHDSIKSLLNNSF